MYISVLEAVSEGIEKISHIMHSKNVNHNYAKKALNLAVEREEILETKIGNRNSIYSPAKKGSELLGEWKKYEEFTERMNSFLGEGLEKK
jgi:predicted transcriptional regulator